MTLLRTVIPVSLTIEPKFREGQVVLGSSPKSDSRAEEGLTFNSGVMVKGHARTLFC